MLFHRLTDKKTRVTLILGYDAEGIVESVGDKLGVVSRRLEGGLGRFKQFVEERQTPTGAWRGEIRQQAAGRGDSRTHYSEPGK